MPTDVASSVHEEGERGLNNNVDAIAVPGSAGHMVIEEQLSIGLIGRALSGPPDACAEVSVALLQSLATSLSKIIGADGAESLLLRIAHRVVNDYPWFRLGTDTLPLDIQFPGLRRCFEGQEPGQAHAASMLFFGTFIDVLTSLIGAHLTTLILKSALGGASAATGSKEQNDE